MKKKTIKTDSSSTAKKSGAKKLYRSNKEKLLAGVLGGFAEYFNTDPTIVRLLFILLAIITGIIPAVILYVIAAILMPKRPF